MSNFNPAQRICAKEISGAARCGRAMTGLAIGAVIGAALLSPRTACAQLSINVPLMEVAANNLPVDALLPDSPGYSSSSAPAVDGAGSGQAAQAPGSAGVGRYAKTVEPGQNAPRLSAGNKFALGFVENVSLTSVAGWFISAGYEQATNGSPNYGEGGKPFAQRLGAAAARNTSENVFSDSVIAPLLHLDPRYYRMGPQHKFVNRVVYAGTRGLITRTDGGRPMINFANIGGDLGGSALTQLYYPPGNRDLDQVLKSWGTSIGSDAVGYVVSEFLPDVLAKFHRR